MLRIERDERVVGVVSSFGCHPVVCCEDGTRIHGDFCGVANTLLEAELPGATALFVQGAQGDINPGFAHMPEADQVEAVGRFVLLENVLAGAHAHETKMRLKELAALADFGRGEAAEQV